MMGAAAEPWEVLMADLLAGTPGVRDAMRGLLRDARLRGDAAAAARAATLMLLHTQADFSDFRGLAEALQAFDPAPPDPADRVRAAAAALGRPSFDHAYSHDDTALAPVRRALFEALRDGAGLRADERLLLGKVLVDHDGMRNDLAAATHVLSLLQDVVPAASLRWQAIWWRMAASIHDYAGHTTLAQAANARFEALLPRLEWPEAAMALAGEEMRQALHVDDLVRAERAFRTIEQQRPRVRPAQLPHGLRAQVSLLLRRGEYGAALERTQLMLDLCEDYEVPLRDRAGYVEQRAHAFTGLRRHAEAVAELEALRATQVGGQAGVLEAIIAMARAVQALDEGSAQAQALALAAVRRAAAVGFHRFLMSFPAWASRIAVLALDAGVEVEFITHAVRERRLAPPEPGREDWPWALHVNAFGHLRVRRQGVALEGAGGKAPRKLLELLALLAVRPQGWDSGELIDQLWPSLDADAPKASLEMAIARLRKWLDLSEAVRVSDGRVTLNAQLVWTDVGAFDAAVQAGDAERALTLYAAPLLGVERPDSVAQRVREPLAHRLAAVVLQQVAVLRAEGRAAEALALLGRGLAREPTNAALQAALRA